MTLSGLRHLRTIIFLSLSSHLVSHSPGNCAFSGSGLVERNHLYHSLGLSVTALEMPVKVAGSIFSSSVILSQAVVVIQSNGGLGGWVDLSITSPPLRKNVHSSSLISPSDIFSFTHIERLSSNLCFSKSERHACLYTAS